MEGAEGSLGVTVSSNRSSEKGGGSNKADGLTFFFFFTLRLAWSGWFNTHTSMKI